MYHRRALAKALGEACIDQRVHIVNTSFIQAVGSLGQVFLEQRGYSRFVAKHTVRAASNAAISIGKPEVFFLGLFAEEAVGSDVDRSKFDQVVSDFHTFVRKCGTLDERSFHWLSLTLSGINPARLGRLIELDRMDVGPGVDYQGRIGEYERILSLGTLDPILRMNFLADVGSHVLADSKTLVKAYRQTSLDDRLPILYRYPIGMVYLPVAEKNGMYDRVDALCSLLSYGVDPKGYFSTRARIEGEILPDLNTVFDLVRENLSPTSGLIREAVRVGCIAKDGIELGIKNTGRTLYKLNFDPSISISGSVRSDTIRENVKDSVRGRLSIGIGGNGRLALEKVCLKLGEADFQIANGGISERSTEFGNGGVFWKVNLLSPAINGKRYYIELQAVPEEMLADLSDGVSDHAIMQASKLFHTFGISGSGPLLSSEVMRAETARHVLRQVVTRSTISLGKDQLPDLRTVFVSCGNRPAPVVIYDGATVADVLAQQINLATPGLRAYIDGVPVALRKPLSIRDNLVQYEVTPVNRSGYDGMGIDRAIGIMGHVVSPEAITQLAARVFSVIFTNVSAGSKTGRKRDSDTGS